MLTLISWTAGAALCNLIAYYIGAVIFVAVLMAAIQSTRGSIFLAECRRVADTTPPKAATTLAKLPKAFVAQTPVLHVVRHASQSVARRVEAQAQPMMQAARGQLSGNPGMLPEGELFVVVYESASHWEFRRSNPDGDPSRPGQKWLTENAVWVATNEGWFAYPSEFSSEEIVVGKPCYRRYGGKVQVAASLQRRDHLADLFRQATR